MYQEWAEQVLTVVREKHGNFANYLKFLKLQARKMYDPVEYAKLEVKMKIIVARQLSIDDTIGLSKLKFKVSK